MDSNDLAPVLIMACIILPIIIRMMLVHQRKMAELVHQVNPAALNAQAAQDNVRLEREISELKQLVMQQSIALDNLSDQVAKSPAPEAVQNRLSGTG
jgi:hypothetical protein